MKILHLSDTGLPDWRVEKSAMTSLKNGHQTIFAGTEPLDRRSAAFSSFHKINWTPKARYGLPYNWYCVKKQLKQILEEVRPDIVHAHNIFSAKMISEFGIPFVYDDHEYWPVYVRRQVESTQSTDYATETLWGGRIRKIARRVARNALVRHAARLWTRWQQEIVSARPTITVSEKIAEELETNYDCRRAFVVSNFPMSGEFRLFQPPQFFDRLSSVYAGIESGARFARPAHRNIDGLCDIFDSKDIGNLIMIGPNGESSTNVTYSGLLSRQAMYQEMFNHSIGLLPMRRHWSHKFISPNKVYEYAHCGLLVMCTSSFSSVMRSFGPNCVAFDDLEHLASKLEYFRDHLDELYHKRLASYEFAKENLVWEKDENKIMEAYQLC